MPMDDRKQKVLRTIVALYETDGEPVGSGLLAEHFDMSVSSATLRNEMAMLTRLGFLEQPHTSAGRVPSAKGMRYYIDNLLEFSQGLSANEKKAFDDIFRELDYDPERLVQGTAKALAEITGLTVIATTPKSDDACIAHFEVVQVGRFTAAVLGVTNAGGVKTRVVKVEFELSSADCKTLEDILNSALTFRAAQDINREYLRGVAAAMGGAERLASPVLNAGYVLLCEAGKESVFIEGQQNLLSDYDTSSHLGTILELVQEPQELQNVICPNKTSRTTVLLGEDMEFCPMPGLCIVSKQYHAGGGQAGMLCVVGSSRMPFMKVIPRLEYFALALGQCITGSLT